MDRQPVTFGRRGMPPARGPIARTAARPADPMQTESGIPVGELAAKLGLGPGSGFGSPARPEGDGDRTGVGGTVRWSFGASLIAGFATSCILTVAAIFNATHGAHPASGGLLGLSPQATLLAAVVESLFSAGTAGGIALPIVHSALKRVGMTQIAAYALGCGAAAAVLNFVPLVGGSDGLVTAAAGGVLTGFFFRLFAGRH